MHQSGIMCYYHPALPDQGSRLVDIILTTGIQDMITRLFIYLPAHRSFPLASQQDDRQVKFPANIYHLLHRHLFGRVHRADYKCNVPGPE